MDRTERFHVIHTLLSARPSVGFQELLDRLEVSRATLKRDLQYLRDRLNAPIVWDPDLRGYRFDSGRTVGDPYELPGIWFTADEIHALLTMQQLLAGLDAGGLLGPHVQPLMARLTTLLDSGRQSADEVRSRVKLIAMGTRKTDLAQFSTVGSALLARKRLKMVFFTKGTGVMGEREVSPQRLVHYRGNWYLDAWCHLKNGLRSFAVDGIRSAEILPTKAKDLSNKVLDMELGAGYGIFSGKALHWAKLRFSAERARWVALEEWHPKQRAQFLKDGRYVLEVPYSDDRELTMDILRHIPEVEVLAPAQLRQLLATKLQAGLKLNS